MDLRRYEGLGEVNYHPKILFASTFLHSFASNRLYVFRSRSPPWNVKLLSHELRMAVLTQKLMIPLLTLHHLLEGNVQHQKPSNVIAITRPFHTTSPNLSFFFFFKKKVDSGHFVVHSIPMVRELRLPCLYV